MAKKKTKKEPKLPQIMIPFEALQIPVMAIDQALDGTGVAFIFPKSSNDIIEAFIQKTLPFFDDRYAEVILDMVNAFKSKKLKGGALYIEPENNRKKEFSFGYVTPEDDSTESFVILHGRIGFEASDTPEWAQSKMIAKSLIKLATDFRNTCLSLGYSEFSIACEGMALNGNKNSISILPCLGILYGKIWEEFMSDDNLSPYLRELPISTWKKAFAGVTSLKKAETKNLLYHMGFSRFGSDDESDAVAMAMTLSSLECSGKITNGRIRPTKEVSAQSRAKKIGIKERREERERLKNLELSGGFKVKKQNQ